MFCNNVRMFTSCYLVYKKIFDFAQRTIEKILSHSNEVEKILTKKL